MIRGTMVCLMTLAVTYALFAQETAGRTGAAETDRKGVLVLDVQPTADESAKRLAVNVHPNGSAQALSGNVDVAGFPQIDGGHWGDVDWKVNGSQVTGTVRNSDGSVEGTFEGTITATGMSGKLTHVDGRTGLWSWNGPPPAQPNVE